jgi:hypothetical protein
MNEMVWRIRTEDKDHVVGCKAGIERGEVFLDGKTVESRDSSYMGVLMKMSFAIDGKPAKVQRRALLSEDWELVFEGRVQPGEEKDFPGKIGTGGPELPEKSRTRTKIEEVQDGKD